MVEKRKDFWVIVYDVADDKRRNKISKILDSKGERVNYSVFECFLTKKEFETLSARINKIIDRGDDSVVYYPICVSCYSKIIYYPKRIQKPNIVVII